MSDDSSEPARPDPKTELKPDDMPRVLVCVDLARETGAIIPPAKAVARALGAELAFVHVIKAYAYTESETPVDPVEWEIMRRENKRRMAQIAKEHGDGDETPATHLLVGHAAEQICGVMAGTPQDIAVLGRGHGESAAHMGETVRRILEHGVNSLLLVPVDAAPKPGFSRIFVPLDCSGRSERIMPIVEKIARSENAEVVLVHAVPEPVFTGAGPVEPEDKMLITQINQRNERVARSYLDQLSGRMRTGGLHVRSLVLSGGDVRRQLSTAIGEQATDLLVLASHGRSGYADVPFGDVANFLISRSQVPTLVVRFGDTAADTHVFSTTRSKGARGPGAMLQ